MNDNNKKALVIAYYLSRFDKVGVKNLGYENFTKACNDIANRIEVKAATIKNMRDEFDSIHDNGRVGWHQRELRPSRKRVAMKFQNLQEEDLRAFVNEIIYSNIDNKEIIENVMEELSDDKVTKGIVLRGVIGKSAENIFIKLYTERFEELRGRLPRGEIIDTRMNGCGYDFCINDDKNEYYIEVKGLSGESGGILFTNKEWETAKNCKDRYYVVLVKNIDKEAEIEIIRNPFNKISPKKNITQVIQINWVI